MPTLLADAQFALEITGLDTEPDEALECHHRALRDVRDWLVEAVAAAAG